MSLYRILVPFALASMLLSSCSEPPRPTINLYRAIHAGDLDQIKRHIYWGTDINQADPDGDNPLHVAARRGRLIIARELLKNGADPNARNRSGGTPVELALKEGKTQLVGVLFDAGASDSPQELLFGLVRSGVDDRDSLELLVQRGARVDTKGPSGDTPLLIAVADGQRRLAKRLLTLGADVNLPDDEGRTPLSVAMDKGDVHMIDLLQRFGARAEPLGAAP